MSTSLVGYIRNASKRSNISDDKWIVKLWDEVVTKSGDFYSIRNAGGPYIAIDSPAKSTLYIGPASALWAPLFDMIDRAPMPNPQTNAK